MLLDANVSPKEKKIQQKFHLIELISYENFCVAKIKYIMYNVQDYSILYNNAVRSVICEGWYFLRMLKALA